jgi:photosystem II stability/assembly factor-like uncharacterized protein
MKSKITLFALILIVTNKFYAQWTEINPGINQTYLSLDCVDNTCYLGGFNGTILKSADGLNWTDVNTTGITDHISSVYTFSNDTCFIIGGSDLYKTYDGGINWVVLSMQTNINYTTVYFINKLIAYNQGLPGEIYKTIDGGENWEWINSTPSEIDNITGNSLYFLNPEIGYIGTTNNIDKVQIYKTVNGALTWTIVYEKTGIVPDDEAIHYIKMITNEIGYACGKNGSILKTIDGGDTWQEQSNPFDTTTKLLRKFDFIDVSNGYIVGSQGGILKTINGGNTWIDESYTNVGLNFADLAILSNDTVIVMPSNSSNKILINQNANLTAQLKNLENNFIKIYPNPTSDIITIETSQNDLFILRDMNGKIVCEKRLTDILTNKIDLENFEEGVFMYSILQQGSEISSGKIVKL